MCIDLQPNATASLDDGDCGPQKGRAPSEVAAITLAWD